jgi:hypothetical protein
MMRDEMFADPWLDTRPSAGPELGLRSAPRSPDALSGTENAGHRGLSSPPDPVPRRAPTTSAALPVGSLLYLVLVGLVGAATIGVFFGAGFLSLVHPGTETAADTDANDHDPSRPYSDAPRAEGPRPPRESAAPDSAAVAAPPGSPLARPAAMAEVPPPQQSETAQNSSPNTSNSQPLARPGLEPEPASGSLGLSPSAMPLASPADVPPPGAIKRRQTRDGRSHHRQTGSRHWYQRTGHRIPPLTPPQPAQTGPFDRLLMLLTGRTGSLTPPRTQ